MLCVCVAVDCRGRAESGPIYELRSVWCFHLIIHSSQTSSTAERALDLFCLPVEIYRLQQQQQHNRLQRQVGLIEFNKVNSSFILFVFAESLTANFNNVVTEFEHMFTVLPEKRDGPVQLVGGSPWELYGEITRRTTSWKSMTTSGRARDLSRSSENRGRAAAAALWMGQPSGMTTTYAGGERKKREVLGDG